MNIFNDLLDKYHLDLQFINNQNFQPFLNTLRICDKATITPGVTSTSYEYNSYMSLQSDDVEGFFLKDANQFYLSCIVQYNYDNFTRNKKLIKGALIPSVPSDATSTNSCEIDLLCTNPINKKKGLTVAFMEKLKIYLSTKGIKYIFLRVANYSGPEDYRIKFYKRLGFQQFDETNKSLMLFIFPTGGRKKRKTIQKRKTRKNSKTRTN